MACATKAHEIYIFCMSRSLTNNLRDEFKDRRVREILDPRVFINRWRGALPEHLRKSDP